MHRFISRIAVIALFVFLCASLPLKADAQSQTYTDPTTGMEFAYIPGGTFTMGNSEDINASPEHDVTVPAFYIGKYEVTFDQFAKYVEEYNRDLPDDGGWGMGTRPVINVNWHEAQAFAQWLSNKTGKTFRLPTEAEWEFAARGGANTAFPWGDDVGTNNANCRNCGSQYDKKMTAPVGSFAPNGYGLYDVAGNVYEWCLDSFHENYEGAPTDGSAFAGGDSSQKINRSASWYRPSQEIRVFQRCWDRIELRNKEIGFRLVMEP